MGLLIALGIGVPFGGTSAWYSSASYLATDSADSTAKGPALIYDAVNDRAVITTVATGSIAAATTAQLVTIAPAAFSDITTFTRTTSATYRDADGNIQLMDRTSTNLNTYSDDFSNVKYTVQNGTIAAIANSWTSFRETVDNSYHRIYIDVPADGTNTVQYTYSCMIEKVGRRYITLRSYFTDGTFRNVQFDLDTLAVTYASTGCTGAIEASGSYFILSVTATKTADTAMSLGVLSTDAVIASDTIPTFVGDPAQGYNIRYIQLETGARTAHIQTTSAAVTASRKRFDYTDGVKRLLLEGAATNKVLYATDITNAAWSKLFCTAGLGTTEGILTSNVLTASSGTSVRFVTAASVTGFVSGTTYTFSSLFGVGTTRYVQLTAPSALFGASQYATFDLTNGVVANSLGGTARIKQVGDKYLCTFSVVASSSGGAASNAIAFSDGSAARIPSVGLTGETIIVWYSQVEAGLRSTSYIPTTSAQVTRAADSALDTAKSLALDSRSAFSIVIKAKLYSVTAGVLWQADDGTANNVIKLEMVSGAAVLTVIAGGVTVAAITTANTVAADTEFGVAFRCAANDFAVSLDGGTVGTDTSGAMPTGLTNAYLGRSSAGTNPAQGRYSERRLYPFSISGAIVYE